MNDNSFVGFLAGVVSCIAIFLIIICPEVSDSGYKSGQIDCLNHKVHFQKVIQSDSSVVWEKIKK
jgi:hypothetical protein